MTPATIAAVGGFDVPGPEVCICEGRGVPKDWTWEGCHDGFRNEVEVGRCGTEERSTINKRRRICDVVQHEGSVISR